MPKFAQYNSKAPQPAPVIGWYDTDELDYPNLPAATELTELSDAEWEMRLGEQWFVLAGKLVPKSDAQILSDAKVGRIGLLESAYAEAICVPLAYLSTTFQADGASQDVLVKTLAAGSVPPGFFWLDAHNVEIAMDFTQLQGLAAAMQAQRQAAFSRLQTLKSQIRTATNMADVQAVVW